MFCQLNLIDKKDPNAKMRKNCKNLSNIEKFFLAHFAHSAFYKIRISGAANLPCPSAICKLCFFFFFQAIIMIQTLYLICIIFVNKCNYILANINTESSRVIFCLFCLHPVGQTFVYPSKFCNHLKHSAK